MMMQPHARHLYSLFSLFVLLEAVAHQQLGKIKVPRLKGFPDAPESIISQILVFAFIFHDIK